MTASTDRTRAALAAAGIGPVSRTEPTPAEIAAEMLLAHGFTRDDLEDCLAEPGASVTVHVSEPRPVRNLAELNELIRRSAES